MPLADLIARGFFLDKFNGYAIMRLSLGGDIVNTISGRGTMKKGNEMKTERNKKKNEKTEEGRKKEGCQQLAAFCRATGKLFVF